MTVAILIDDLRTMVAIMVALLSGEKWSEKPDVSMGSVECMLYFDMSYF